MPHVMEAVVVIAQDIHELKGILEEIKDLLQERICERTREIDVSLVSCVTKETLEEIKDIPRNACTRVQRNRSMCLFRALWRRKLTLRV